jgi:hypothetical protein
MNGDCSFCWYWWKCWPSLFKISFHNEHFTVKVTHDIGDQWRNVKSGINVYKTLLFFTENVKITQVDKFARPRKKRFISFSVGVYNTFEQ